MYIDIRSGRVIASAAAVVLAVGGGIAIAVAVDAQKTPPQPPLAAASSLDVIPTSPASVPRPPVTTTGSSTPTSETRGPILARSAPIALRIPAIDVTSAVKPVGLNPDHTVQTPPLSKDSYAGWYKYSPTPGSLGPAIILGHIDSAAYGPAVFFRLGDLRQGDAVYVTRADGTIALFRIERVVEYAKNTFPTLEVYGNIDHAGLRLITCGGKFDFSTRNYEDNIVAYASLVSSRHR